MVVREGVPRPVDLEWAGRLAGIGVAQISGDDAVLVLEFVERVERVGLESGNCRVEPAAGDHQQREAGANLRVANANLALLEERHGNLLQRCDRSAHRRWPGALADVLSQSKESSKAFHCKRLLAGSIHQRSTRAPAAGSTRV